MNYKCTSLITASVLALAATSATGQIQSDSPRQSLQIAERLTNERSGLHSAIAIAEMHTKGVAIGVRLTDNQAHFSGRGGVQGQTLGHTSDFNQDNRQQSGQPRTAEQERQQREQQQRQQQQQREQQQRQQQQQDRQQDRQTGQYQQDRQTGQQTRYTDQQGAQSGQLFAIVTCVVDRTRVRDVIIDMSNNTVVGVQAASFGSGQSYAGQSGDGSNYSSEYESASGSGDFALASDLMNTTVRARNGEQLGDIDELAIDPDNNRVVYGVLRRGGILGMGESRYAIPTSELTAPRNGRMVIGLQESHFNNVSGFDNNNWPTQAESRLRQDRSSQASDGPTARRVVKASNIIGNDILCRDGNDLGEVTDLVIEPRTGRILYAIVDTNRGHMPVPMSSMTRKSDETYTLPMAMDQLRSMQTIDMNRSPNWSDESWNRRIHEAFGVRFEQGSQQGSQPGSQYRDGR